jgi:CRISPR-associated endonuclease Csn1
VEHILPYSRTLLDAESNLTVAHASCNAFKRERSPYEAFGSSPKGYDWNEICARVDSLADRAKRNRFTPDAMDVFEKDSGFITRQLTDNAYLSKTALRYLTCICDSVWAVSGGMTKLLRDKWEIDSILNRKIDDKVALALGIESAKIGEYKKNRYDHRHHALDAIIIGLIDRSMVQNIASMCARSQKYRIEVPPLPVSRYEIIEKLKNITVSFKPDHGAEGKLSKETLLGRIRQEMKIPVNELSEEDIPNIKDSRVREEFEELIAERKDFRKAVKELRNTYPEVQVFRHTFVNRTPLVSLKTEKNIEDIVAPLIREKLRCLLPPVRGKNLNTCLPLSVRKQV